jgi:dTDP-4-dehydrorhamnose reductase
MATLLILGANGMLGHKMCQQLSGHVKVATVRGSQEYPSKLTKRFPEIFRDVRLLEGVDFLQSGSVERALDAVRPDVVVNCAGIVKQAPAATSAYHSVAINAYLPHLLAKYCAERDCRLIHISTDCVFSGSRGRYVEDDPADALDLYGRSKALGETGASDGNSLTLRTSIIGREIGRPCHGLLEWFLARRGESVRGFTRAVFSGLTTIELARVVQEIIDDHSDLCGLFHVASQSISKHDLLHLLRRIYGMNTEIEPDDELVCDRSLVMGKFTAATGYEAPSWKAMVERMQRDPTPYDLWFPPR